MVVDDCFIQVRMITTTILGVILALVLGERFESFFSGGGDKFLIKIRHDDGSVLIRNCGVIRTSMLRRRLTSK